MLHRFNFLKLLFVTLFLCVSNTCITHIRRCYTRIW